MMSKNILGAYIVPHPPIIIPEVGEGRETEAQKTIDSMMKISKILRLNPDTIVVTTPHSYNFSDHIYIMTEETLKGDLSKFVS